MSDPNVLVVICDDLGYGDLGCYGAEYGTPNIDRIAGGGVRLTDWHGNAPVCSPTRASLLTGKYPQRVGVPANAPQGRPETVSNIGLEPEETTLADALSGAGYRCGAFGKWHLGSTERDDPLANGFDEWFGFLSGCVDYYSHTMVWQQSHGTPPYHDLWEGQEEVWHNGEYLTDLITDRAVAFIEDSPDPFFAYVAFNAPHYPMHAPAEYFDRFPDLSGDRRTQAAMVAALDDAVGDLLDTLEREGVGDETLIVFTSDHGPSREVRNHLDGSRDPYNGGKTGGFRGEKFSLFEGGIRVPGIVRYPDAFAGGRDCDELAATMDVFPTVLDYCGLSVPDDADGKSLRPVLEEDAETPHDRLYWAFGDQLAVRDGDWKLVVEGREVGDDPVARHLADLESDPGESTNRVDEHREFAGELGAAARQWADRVGNA
jgi:arylsulfatase A-like enzyme